MRRDLDFSPTSAKKRHRSSDHGLQFYNDVGMVTKVETISPPWDLVDTPCDYASYCGGCKTQNLIYEAQVKAKEHQVHQLIINFETFSRTELESLSIMKPIKKHDFAIMFSSCFYHIRKQLLNLANTTYLLFVI
ncbi:hypothetical protein DVH24_021944 [Malus domestica]|uniref:Uncharacterized protein n=1 Tax=Malus domestica TaxID=3750 RepID=A0A498IZD0_MALDO|nr:hypothetical protein DVH24_021944 [Malus domestica]